MKIENAIRLRRRTLIGGLMVILLLLTIASVPTATLRAQDGMNQTPTPVVTPLQPPLRLPATGYTTAEPPPSALTLTLAGVGALFFVAGGMAWFVGRRR